MLGSISLCRRDRNALLQLYRRTSDPQLRQLATRLHERLNKAAEMLDRLAAAGWSARVAMYDAILTRSGVETKDAAERLLGELGLAVDEFIIIEDVEEEEECGHA
jgi:Mn-dependent DtxR family transcriptional regulator